MASLDATAFIPTGVPLEEFFSKQKTKKNRLLHQLIATHHLLFLSCLVFVGESAENRRKKKQFQSSSRTPTTCLYTFFLLYILRSAQCIEYLWQWVPLELFLLCNNIIRIEKYFKSFHQFFFLEFDGNNALARGTVEVSLQFQKHMEANRY